MISTRTSNKTIILNTTFLYIRLVIVSICQLLITRFALKALGADDFGLFSIIGSVIIFIGIINTIMVATSNRFIAVSIGKGDNNVTNQTFNISLVIHIVIAFFTAVVAIPLGELYINHYVNYNGFITNAIWVYRIIMIGSILSFISVPYHGLLTAMEKFVVFCSIDIFCNILKMAAACYLMYYAGNKLIFYALSQSLFTAIPTFLYWIYCKKYYYSIIKWNFQNKIDKYKEMLCFSGWVGFGAIATVGKTQAAHFLVNIFFTTTMNAALGIANTINHFIVLFANNITQPIAPQVTKSYAAGNYERCNKLLIASTKFTFLTMLVISSPFFSDIDWILKLWLGNIPEYASLFTIFIVIDALIASFNAGISNVIFASGKIVFYQLSINSVRILSVLGAYYAIRITNNPSTIFIVYIVFSFLIAIFTQIALQRIGRFNFKSLLFGSYIPSLMVLLLYIPILYIKVNMHPIIHILLVLLYLSLIIIFVGFKKKDRIYVINVVKSKLNK